MYVDKINRAPKVEVLPDMRLRVTRVYDILDFTAKTTAQFSDKLEISWGTQDETFPQCRLINQDEAGQGNNPAKQPNDPPPQLIRIFEEIDASAETQVGRTDVSFDQYGRRTVVNEFLQFSTGTSVYQIVGTTAAPSPFSDCILKTEERTNDGTLQRIKRTYIDIGQLSDSEELKFGGRLLLRTLTYLNEIPPTPAGFTLVTTSIEFIEGLPVYRYGYASAASGIGLGGQISDNISYSQSDDQGTTGVTIRTITQITDDSVVSNPIATPSGFTLIGVTQEADAGYIIWTAKFAKGVGLVTNDVETKEGGKLIIYRRVSLDSVPATPSATIGGTVTLISAGFNKADGYDIYSYQWAEGIGEVSRSTEYKISPNQGTTGVTVTAIKYLTAISVAINPITGPVGSSLINVSYDDADGYRIWNATYAFGQGQISSSIDIRNNGNLYIYSRTSINAVPSTPSPSIGGTVVSIKTSVRNGTDASSGNLIYDYDWAEGDGVIETSIDGDPDGALTYVVIELDAVSMTPAYPGSGTAYLVNIQHEARDGHYLNRATYKKPPADDTFNKQQEFQEPGVASFTGSPPQFVLQPPKQRTLLVNVAVTYSTSQISDTPFSIDAYAAFYESYIPETNPPGGASSAQQNQRGLGGYLAGASGISGTNSDYNGVLCREWQAALLSSIPSSFPTGTVVLHVDNDPYLTATDGTRVYRRTKTTYSF